MEQLFNSQRQNNGINSFRYFHLFAITLHRNKEYDEHSLIKNYSHSHITSQNMNSFFPLQKVLHPYFLEQGKYLIVFNAYIISKMENINENSSILLAYYEGSAYCFWQEKGL